MDVFESGVFDGCKKCGSDWKRMAYATENAENETINDITRWTSEIEVNCPAVGAVGVKVSEAN